MVNAGGLVGVEIKDEWFLKGEAHLEAGYLTRDTNHEDVTRSNADASSIDSVAAHSLFVRKLLRSVFGVYYLKTERSKEL